MDARIEILNQLMNKSGIYGYAAKIYFHDEEKSKELIFECYEQCHVQGAIDNWGEKLVNEIKNFCELHDKNIKKPNFAWERKLPGLSGGQAFSSAEGE